MLVHGLIVEIVKLSDYAREYKLSHSNLLNKANRQTIYSSEMDSFSSAVSSATTSQASSGGSGFSGGGFGGGGGGSW